MSFSNSSNFTVRDSTFTDISGDVYQNSVAPGAQGIEILLGAACCDAAHNSLARDPPPKCHPGTRAGVRERISHWIEHGKEKVFCLYGAAGAGKSAIAQTIAEAYAQNEQLAGSFFFSRGSSDRGTATHLISTLAYHIVTAIPEKRGEIGAVLEADPSILKKSLDVQLQKLIIEPLQSWRNASGASTFLVIIDGLDECAGDRQQSEIVKLVGQLAMVPNLRCFITCRPEPHLLLAVICLTKSTKATSLSLSKFSTEAITDIYSFLLDGFDAICDKFPHIMGSIHETWPPEWAISLLSARSGGIFVYASTILKYINNEDALPTARLKHVLDLSPGTTPFGDLDKLYTQILSECPQDNRSTLLRIFGIALLQCRLDHEDHLKVDVIEELLGLEPGQVRVTLRRIHSILDLASLQAGHLAFLHLSFEDFIFDPERADEFYIDRDQEHFTIALKCFSALSGQNSQVTKFLVYSWRNWSHHCNEAGAQYHQAIINALREVDPSAWAHSLPGSHHDLCIEGLDVGIQWLETLEDQHALTDLISHLHDMRQRLDSEYCIRTITDFSQDGFSLLVPVFADPGLEFVDNFSIANKFVIALAVEMLVPLYFVYHNKIHRLDTFGSYFPADFLQSQNNLEKFFGIEQNVDQGLVACHCIDLLRQRSQFASSITYEAQHWAIHVFYATPGDIDVIAQLQRIEIIPVRSLAYRITPEDAELVMKWLLQSKMRSKSTKKAISQWRSIGSLLKTRTDLGIAGRGETASQRFKVNKKLTEHRLGVFSGVFVSRGDLKREYDRQGQSLL